jgi:ribosome-associated translation inhibitor RaiA
MRIDIRSKGFSVTDGIRHHVHRRLGYALDRFRDVAEVIVCLGDVNGPKGGADKFCRMATEIGSATAVVEEIQPDLYVAISRAAHRLALKVAREVERANRSAPPRSRAAYGGAA